MSVRRWVPPAGLLLCLLLPAGATGQEAAADPDAPRPAGTELPPHPAEVIRVVERPDPARLAVRELPSPLTREEVARLELALAEAGFDPGRRDGALDERTEAALLAYQKRHGLSPCGCPTYETVTSLGLPTLMVVRLGYAELPTREPRRRPPADSTAAAEGASGDYPQTPTYWFPVLLHRRVPLEPPEGEGGEPAPTARTAPTGARPPGVRPAPPPDPRSFPRGR